MGQHLRGNYMTDFLKPSRCWIFWDKMKYVDNYADGELAWTSFDRNTKKVQIQHHGFLTKDKGSAIHPTQKPVELMEYLIKTYTNENETVLDNTMGSGTTGLACLKTNRQFIGIEKEKQYYDVAVRRLSSYCG